MIDKEIITDGCEFQSDCIEYKDISYLKIMPICAIHELSIACHDKVNKCKYYKLYKQLKRKEQECEELKEKVKELHQGWIDCDKERNLQEANSQFRQRVINRYKQTLIEIKEIAGNMNNECFYSDFDCKYCDMKNGCTYQGRLKILQKISEVEND